MKRLTQFLRQPRSSRVGFAAVLTVAVVGAFALMGGLGHASIGSTSASAAEYQYHPKCDKDGRDKNRGKCDEHGRHQPRTRPQS